MKGNPDTAHGHRKPVAHQAARLHLQPLQRTIHVPHRGAAARLFTEHMPGLQRRAQLELDVPLLQIPDEREAEFEVRREPFAFERITRLAQIADDILEIGFAEMRQHPAIMDVRAPADQAGPVRLLPELGHQAAQQEMLRQAHARVRRHFKCAHLDQHQPALSARRETFGAPFDLAPARLQG